MNTFDHIILTRVNTMRSDWTTEWLINRIELFKQFCYPSIKAQTNQNFKWLVFLDSRTPDNVRSDIQGLTNNLSSFIPVYVPEYNNNVIVETIKEHTTKSDYLITSRIDTDDAYTIDYIQKTQELFLKLKKDNSRIVVNFDKGFVYNKNTNILYIRSHYVNAFCSLIEPMQNFISVWDRGHMDLGLIGKVKRVQNNPMWLQVVHGENLANSIKKQFYIVPLKSMIKRVGIDYNINTNDGYKYHFSIWNIYRFIMYLLITSLRPVKRGWVDLFSYTK